MLASRLVRLVALPLALTFSVVACSDSDDPSDGSSSGGTTAVSADQALTTYADHLLAAYTDSVTAAQALKTKLQALVDAPTEANLAAARTEWLASREPYMLTEGARFYEGPIDSEELGNREGLLNAWPLDEAYIDYVVDGPTRGEDQGPGSGGIVADTSISLTPEELNLLNGEGGEENVAAGYHAIEFLLWGQATAKVGPGQRPASDFDPADPVRGATAARRGQYLIAAIDGIIANLQVVADQWKEGSEYRTTFLANENNTSLTHVLSGFGKLSRGEMAGERINAGLESKERRDQHNCFSSTTWADYERDARGILEFYKGIYKGDDGPGFDDLVGAADATVNDKLVSTMQATVDGIKAIQSVPFEEAIQGLDTDPSRAKVIEIRESFRAQGSQFGDAARVLGITLTIPDTND